MTSAPSIDGELPGMDRRDPDWAIHGTWLVNEVGTCTCEPYYGTHQPGCGLEPIVDLSTLRGWGDHIKALTDRLPEVYGEPRVIPSRNTDPTTSHQAAKAITVKAGTQRAHLLAAFAELVDGTDEEAMARAEWVSPSSEYSKRCSELREVGMIEPTGETRPGRSGQARIVSRITPKGLNWLTEMARG